MTPETVKAVRRSFLKVAPIADEAAAMFYERLFEIAPEVRPLFKADLSDQGRKLMKTLGFAVASLDDLDRLVPALENLGQAHDGYGVEPAHYDSVGEALLWTLEQGLGDEFTPEIKAAWTEVYGVVADVMKSAAEAKAA